MTNIAKYKWREMHDCNGAGNVLFLFRKRLHTVYNEKLQTTTTSQKYKQH